MVSVRDARIDEEDPLLGVVFLPLNEIFKERSQVMGFWPLTGGVGYGRIRLSMVWRSLQLNAPPNMLGWDYGTLEVQPWATVTDDSQLPQDTTSTKLKFKTSLSSGKMHYDKDQGKWTAKREESLKLAVNKRYSTCLSVALKHKGKMGENVDAFCVLWLKDLVDEETTEMDLTIWKGDFKRATACCLTECGEKLGTLKLKLTFWAGLVSQDLVSVLSGVLTRRNRVVRIPSGLAKTRISGKLPRLSTQRGTTSTRTRRRRRLVLSMPVRSQATIVPQMTTAPTTKSKMEARATREAQLISSRTTRSGRRGCTGSTAGSCSGR
jgi:hypothetical protein